MVFRNDDSPLEVANQRLTRVNKEQFILHLQKHPCRFRSRAGLHRYKTALASAKCEGDDLSNLLPQSAIHKNV